MGQRVIDFSCQRSSDKCLVFVILCLYVTNRHVNPVKYLKPEYFWKSLYFYCFLIGVASSIVVAFVPQRAGPAPLIINGKLPTSSHYVPCVLTILDRDPFLESNFRLFITEAPSTKISTFLIHIHIVSAHSRTQKFVVVVIITPLQTSKCHCSAVLTWRL